MTAQRQYQRSGPSLATGIVFNYVRVMLEYRVTPCPSGESCGGRCLGYHSTSDRRRPPSAPLSRDQSRRCPDGPARCRLGDSCPLMHSMSEWFHPSVYKRGRHMEGDRCFASLASPDPVFCTYAHDTESRRAIDQARYVAWEILRRRATGEDVPVTLETVAQAEDAVREGTQRARDAGVRYVPDEEVGEAMRSRQVAKSPVAEEESSAAPAEGWQLYVGPERSRDDLDGLGVPPLSLPENGFAAYPGPTELLAALRAARAAGWVADVVWSVSTVDSAECRKVLQDLSDGSSWPALFVVSCRQLNRWLVSLRGSRWLTEVLGGRAFEPSSCAADVLSALCGTSFAPLFQLESSGVSAVVECPAELLGSLHFLRQYGRNSFYDKLQYAPVTEEQRQQLAATNDDIKVFEFVLASESAPEQAPAANAQLFIMFVGPSHTQEEEVASLGISPAGFPDMGYVSYATKEDLLFALRSARGNGWDADVVWSSDILLDEECLKFTHDSPSGESQTMVVSCRYVYAWLSTLAHNKWFLLLKGTRQTSPARMSCEILSQICGVPFTRVFHETDNNNFSAFTTCSPDLLRRLRFAHLYKGSLFFSQVRYAVLSDEDQQNLETSCQDDRSILEFITSRSGRVSRATTPSRGVGRQQSAQLCQLWVGNERTKEEVDSLGVPQTAEFQSGYASYGSSADLLLALANARVKGWPAEIAWSSDTISSEECRLALREVPGPAWPSASLVVSFTDIMFWLESLKQSMTFKALQHSQTEYHSDPPYKSSPLSLACEILSLVCGVRFTRIFPPDSYSNALSAHVECSPTLLQRLHFAHVWCGSLHRSRILFAPVSETSQRFINDDAVLDYVLRMNPEYVAWHLTGMRDGFLSAPPGRDMKDFTVSVAGVDFFARIDGHWCRLMASSVQSGFVSHANFAKDGCPVDTALRALEEASCGVLSADSFSSRVTALHNASFCGASLPDPRCRDFVIPQWRHSRKPEVRHSVMLIYDIVFQDDVQIPTRSGSSVTPLALPDAIDQACASSRSSKTASTPSAPELPHYYWHPLDLELRYLSR